MRMFFYLHQVPKDFTFHIFEWPTEGSSAAGQELEMGVKEVRAVLRDMLRAYARIKKWKVEKPIAQKRAAVETTMEGDRCKATAASPSKKRKTTKSQK